VKIRVLHPPSPAKVSQVLELQDNREYRPPSPARDPELQESTGRRPPSPVKESQGLELHGNMERMSPSPARDQELQGNTERMSPSTLAQVSELYDTKGKRPGSPLAKDKDL
jgi:hypothetical protein